MTQSSLTEAILKLKAEKRAIILSHYYTRGEVQAVADFVGDSLALAVQAEKADADIILFFSFNMGTDGGIRHVSSYCLVYHFALRNRSKKFHTLLFYHKLTSFSRLYLYI